MIKDFSTEEVQDLSYQGVCQSGIPQGDSIWLDTASDVDMDGIWNFVEEPQQTDNVPSGGITATPCIPPFSPNGHGTTFVALA